MELAKQTVLVTGANRGLGKAFVEALLEAGVPKIYATARNAESLAAVKAAHPGRVETLTLDITDPKQIDDVADVAGDVTLLVNNAGVLDFARPLETDSAILDRNMTTNFVGTYNMTTRFADVIAANGGGRIVNLLTFLCFVSAPLFAAYNASKSASWSMAMSLRPYLRKNGVEISNVFPTSIDTDMLAALDKDKDTPEDVARSILKGVVAEQEDIFPCGASATFDAWRADYKAIEGAFAKIG